MQPPKPIDDEGWVMNVWGGNWNKDREGRRLDCWLVITPFNVFFLLIVWLYFGKITHWCLPKNATKLSCNRWVT